jgi:hypothetical protein
MARNTGIHVKVGAVAVTVIGASVAATSVATVMVATGGLAVLGASAYGIYRWCRRTKAPPERRDVSE